ncbi:MAG TPA: insulinase family protein, partial [Chloroflexota bacterium]|nr:insulinase family protein [Chloroflexota bacterium]
MTTMTMVEGFVLQREAHIPELNTRARLYRHAKTGAEILSLENDDENKVFGITFRTPVSDSTGVMHILEHSVLGGSKKYPVKEPFIELAKGSLKTFLNALTYPDRTCYPVASTNSQDFYNLMDVYLDAVFNPLLTPEHLQQEGWHYELNAPDEPLTYKGIVFNEMKGAYSSPERALGEQVEKSIFPDNAYHFSSGGDPRNIPDLTYEHFKSTYQTYYHPSNALIFFYGDDDPTERLRRIDAYLRDYEHREVDGIVALQARFAQPRKVVESYGVGPEVDLQKKAMVAVSWLLGETTNPESVLAHNILEYILIGTPASPLRRALIDSGLGEDLVPLGLDDSIRQMYFSTGLKGIAVEDAERVEELILRTLSELADRGIEQDVIAAALNTLEFRLRENNTGRMPRGLSLMFRCLAGWVYGGDPIELLQFEAPLAAIKARLANGERVFEEMIRRDFLENSHRTTVILKPDPDLNRREEDAEKERLARARAAMSPEEVTAVVEMTKRLRQRQEAPDSPEALATIPRLSLADLDRQNKPIPSELLERAGTRVLYHDLATNGIVYLDVGFDVHNLPQELLPYLPLFGRAMLETGTAREDFAALSRHIGRETGGIRTEILNSAIRGSSQASVWFFFRGKATLGQADELLAILKDVLLTARLDDRERFRQIALEEKARLESAIVPGGSGIVAARLGAHFDEAHWVQEQMRGVSNLFFVRQLVQMVNDDWLSVQAALEKIRQILLNRQTVLSNVTLDSKGWEQLAPRLDAFLADLPTGAAEHATWAMDRFPAAEGLGLPGGVNYVGKGTNLFSLGYRYHGSSEVVS